MMMMKQMKQVMKRRSEKHSLSTIIMGGKQEAYLPCQSYSRLPPKKKKEDELHPQNRSTPAFHLCKKLELAAFHLKHKYIFLLM